MDNMQEILMDMVRLSPMAVFKKHRIGIQIQNRIKEVVVEGFMKEVSEGICAVCKKELISGKKPITVDKSHKKGKNSFK